MKCWECGTECPSEHSEAKCSRCHNLLFPIIRKPIEEYSEANSTPESDLLAALTKESNERLKESHMLVGRLESGILRLFVSICRAKRVLEIGTYTGFSAIAMAEALPEDGKLIAVDNFSDENASEEICRKYFALTPHSKKLDLWKMTGKEALSRLTANDAFDFIFIDADKEGQIEYFETILNKKLLSPNGLIAVDNTLWGGLVCNKEQNQITSDIHKFNQHVAADTRTEKVILTVRDGLTVIRWKNS